MSIALSAKVSLLGAGLFLGIANRALHAQQEQLLYSWTGPVDDEIQLTMRGGRAWAGVISGHQSTLGQFRVQTALPQEDGRIRVEVDAGRGGADVVQQPVGEDGYTAVVRVVDRYAGADRYAVRVYWTPAISRAGGTGNRGYPDPDGGLGARRGNDDDEAGRYGNRQDRVDPDDARSRGRGENGRGSQDGDAGRYESSGANGGGASGGPGTLHWSGDVDRDVEIQLHGNRTSYTTLSGAATRNVRSRVSGSGLPSREAYVGVSVREGRGSVSVVQQPTSQNGYTAVILVRDPQGGYGHYDFDVAWQSAGRRGR
jgi:hypothetical protein